MAKKQTRHLDTSWDTESAPEPQEPAIETVDTTTEQPITLVLPEGAGDQINWDISYRIGQGETLADIQQSFASYTPAPDDPLLAVRLELPMTVLFALIDQSYPQADYAGAVYYGLIERGGLTPLGKLVLAGVDQTLLRHKLNAAWRIEYNKMIGG